MSEKICNLNKIGGGMVKYHDTVTGTGTVLLPSAFEMLFIVINVSLTVHITITIPRASLSSSDKSFRSGYYINANQNAEAEILAKDTSLHLASAFLNGTDYKNSSVATIYYS